MKNILSISFFLLLLAELVNSQALPANLDDKSGKVYSFENGIPSNFMNKGGHLETSSLRYGTGKKSLYWQCKPGDKLLYKGEIGYHPAEQEETVVFHGRKYPQYGRPVALMFFLYNEKRTNAELKISFGRNGKTDCYAKVLLNYVGWRPVSLLYERGHFIGEPHPDMDECAFELVGDEEVGVYFDDLNFATKALSPLHHFYPESYLPTRRLHPERQSYGAWRAKDSHLNRPWLPLTTPTTEELEAIKTIEERVLDIHFEAEDAVDQLTEKEMEGVRKEFAEINVTEKDGIINGPLYTYDIQMRTKNNKLMKKMGLLYRKTKDVDQQKELADKIILLYKHGKQTKIPLDWYDGRGFVFGLYLIKDELKKQGLLEEAIKFSRECYDFNRMYDENRTVGYEGNGENSDVVYTNLMSEMMTVLMMEDGPEKIRDMRHYTSFVSNVCFNYAPGIRDCMKPDGSHYHHLNALNTGYGNYTPVKMAIITRILSRTTFRISEEAHERLKHAARVRYFISSPTYLPNSFLHKSYPKNRLVLNGVYSNLAYAGTPDGKQEIDTEMAALYASTAFTAKMSEDEKKLVKDYPTKASAASGHHTMTYTADGFHRRDDWLVSIASFSQYFYQQERANLAFSKTFSQFVNWGNIDVIYPDTANALRPVSGFKPEGWDHTRYAGATTIKAPIDTFAIKVLRTGDDYDEHMRSDQPFVGGLDFSDGNGLFVSPIHGSYKYGLESFYATKSYFFFDDLVICLGTNIRNNLPQYETQTTLFQNNLIKSADPVYVNKTKSISKFPYVETINGKKDNWLMDNRQVGYYIPAGQDINIRKATQVADYGDKESGNFASAWLNHGKAPESASYEYAMKIKTSPEEMKEFANSMSKKEAPYQVIKADADAHIIKHNESNTTALILHQKDYELNVGKIKGVTHSSLVMLKEKGNKINLAVADPDMRFFEGYPDEINRDFSRREIPSYSHSWYGNKSIPSTVRVMLHGNWDIKNIEKGNAKIVQQANDVTIVEFVCSEGFTNEVELE